MKLVNTLAVLLLFGGTAFSQTADVKIFDAEKVKDAALITWTTKAETLASHFEIQRSDDGVNWTTIALVFSFEDNSIEHHYRYTDKSSKQAGAGYRLRQLNLDKTETFTGIKIAGATAIKR